MRIFKSSAFAGWHIGKTNKTTARKLNHIRIARLLLYNRFAILYNVLRAFGT
jgi:hypothetical protein